MGSPNFVVSEALKAILRVQVNVKINIVMD